MPGRYCSLSSLSGFSFSEIFQEKAKKFFNVQESCRFGLYNGGVDANEGERNDGETKAICDDKKIKRSPKRNEGKFCRRISGKSADDRQ